MENTAFMGIGLINTVNKHTNLLHDGRTKETLLKLFYGMVAKLRNKDNF
jgi:CxxC motif-containing protein (DUF1111 family)